MVNMNSAKNAVSKTAKFLGALDVGTSSIRFMLFKANSSVSVACAQEENPFIFPEQGWVEQEPKGLVTRSESCITEAVKQFTDQGYDVSQIKGVGISTQRETVVVWDKKTGNPLHNAVVWSDVRTADLVHEYIQKTETKSSLALQKICGLPIATYFSALKLRWIFDKNPEIQEKCDRDEVLCGTVDSWLIYNFTKNHVTDVSNAARTMLMDLHQLKWSDELLDFFKLSPNILPEIKSSAEVYGSFLDGTLKGIPISGCLGDQSAALLGQACVEKGQCGATFGTGCFLLKNTGQEPVFSDSGLLTTVAFKLGKEAKIQYALEGSVAVAGSAVRWLRDNLGIIDDIKDIEKIAGSVPDSGGVCFVPAFSGLYAPYWRDDARGIIVGLSQHSGKSHIVRACLDAVCLQTMDIINSMQRDDGNHLTSLNANGGMCANSLLMQTQADVLECQVFRPDMKECSALGAAMAAGVGLGIWDADKIKADSIPGDIFHPKKDEKGRKELIKSWRKGVARSLGWARRNSVSESHCFSNLEDEGDHHQELFGSNSHLDVSKIDTKSLMRKMKQNHSCSTCDATLIVEVDMEESTVTVNNHDHDNKNIADSASATSIVNDSTRSNSSIDKECDDKNNNNNNNNNNSNNSKSGVLDFVLQHPAIIYAASTLTLSLVLFLKR